ncbi:MAG: hypothetical protein A2Z75_04255 [Chloroflexi bacterium RBG_13_50_10]|nr:MAG: hypothetical protein A2Z75_04255 [Chloroflexi bacterium RBG_13_50_10]
MKRLLVIFTVLSLVLPILLTACGGDEEETYTATPIATATATTTVTATPTATPTATATPSPDKGPVKIGAIGPWSGPFAMAGLLYDPVMSLVEEQVKNQGGILGGREVKFFRGDDRGVVAESAAQAKKLIMENDVTILTWGGVSGAHFNAVSDVAEEYKVPYVGLGLLYGLATKKYSACLIGVEPGILDITSVVVDFLKPKTVAFLAYDAQDMHALTDGIEGVTGYRERLKAAGIDIVYEQYFPMDTSDLSPYLTKIKYLKPDLLFSYPNNPGQAILINRQIAELGGWGSIKYICGTEVGTEPAAIKVPSAVGTYSYSRWIPGSDEPGMKAFDDAFKQKYGKLPNYNQTYAYNDFWTAVKAIEMAGTDNRDKVAQALRSGNLEWDSAWGPLRIDSNGTGWYHSTIVQIQEGGKLVKVWPQ